MNKIIHLITIILMISACSNAKKSVELSEMEKWKLGWRMIASNWEGNYTLGETQFDSLLIQSDRDIELKFLITGLEILSHLDKKEKLLEILEHQDQEVLQEICIRDLFTQKLNDVDVCKSIAKEKVGNPELQMELIRMYVDDQAARGNLMEDIIQKYSLDKTEVSNEDGVTVDAKNRQRLKVIFNEFGFPTRSMVGKDAMHGVFLMIQHSDGDKDWQKAQLRNIEQAVKNGDLDGQSYAYLYDRININAGQKQRYGTQFSNVDPLNNIVELADTEEIGSLDQRRMEIGMMPIDMYKELMLKNLKN
ncbi:MAG TPA: DUF6624 domain-containing protein [Cytophagales bacterium]|nr:DUF6624 domain-containing protein [Cytophagales bacterium]